MTARAEARARPAAAERVKSGRAGARLRAWREQHLYSLVSSLGRLAARPFATLLTVGVMAIAIALPLGLGLALGNIERFSGSRTSTPRGPPRWRPGCAHATASPRSCCARRRKGWKSSAR